MSELAVSTSVRATNLDGATHSGDDFLRAFNEVRAELVSTLFFLLGNHEDAQDAAQDAFLKCWRTRRRLGRVRNLRAWIFRVGLNAARDFQRQACRHHLQSLAHFSPMATAAGPTPEEVLEEKEDRQRFHDALQELSPEESALVLLRQNGQQTYQAIAGQRGCPVSTVKTQMWRAVRKLRRALTDTPIAPKGR